MHILHHLKKKMIELIENLFNDKAVVLSGILLSAVLAAIMSTADSQLLASSSAFASDIYKAQIKKDASDKTVMNISRATVVIISLLAGIIEAFSQFEPVQHAFGGVRICVCILIINAVSKLYKKAVVDRLTLFILLLVTLGSYFTPLSPAIFVVIAAIIGICVKKLEGGKKK